MRRAGVVAAMIALVLMSLPWSSARSADWDHDANIDAAVLELLTTYRQGGMAVLERRVEDCYRLVDDAGDADERLRRFEFCAGMDLAAVRLDLRDAPDPAPVPGRYFGMEALMARVGRLFTFLQDPNVGNQVIRAWSLAAAEALARHAD